MKYVYTVFERFPGDIKKRVDSPTTNWFDALTLIEGKDEFTIEISNSLNNEIYTLSTAEQVEDWHEVLARAASWSDSADKGRNTSHKNWDPMNEEETDIHMKSPSDSAKITSAINPKHYSSFMDISKHGLVLQWLEAQQYLPRFRNPENFKSAVELQIRKYLDRNGGKDPELQELRKALWYLQFLVAYITNGNSPISVKDINELLKT